jgi:DNA-directed RNA polymerase subunit alpha
MRIRWRGLELPTQVIKEEAVSTPVYGRFIIEPFERGFGTTVGNSLRRILLSSLEGAAPISLKLKGAQHEFTSLPGVLEDVTDIVLNVKSLVVQLEGEEPKTMSISRSTRGEIRAKDFQADPAITLINTDQLIATLTDDVEFELEVVVAKGRGYLAAEDSVDEEREIGMIPVDSLFSPVSRVRYHTEDTRVGQRTNYDRLIMEIWTKGTVTPDMALVEAAKILRKHLNPFVQYFELGAEVVGQAPAEAAPAEDVDKELQAKLDMPISELDLSVRAGNCLEAAKIATVRDLVRWTEAELLSLRSFGKTSLREVKRKLADIGLNLGMNLEAPGAGNPTADASETTSAVGSTVF